MPQLARLFRAVAMLSLHMVPGPAQSLGHILCDHHRSMLAAGAAEANREVTLSLADVVWHQVHQQLRDAVDELASLRKLPDVGCNPRVPPGQRAKLRNEVRIRKEADVEHQVGIGGHSVLEAKTHAGNQNALIVGSGLELVEDVTAQL